MENKRGGNSLWLNQWSDGFSRPPLLFWEERKKTAKNILEKLKSEEWGIQFKGLEENEICNRKLKPVFAEGRSENSDEPFKILQLNEIEDIKGTISWEVSRLLGVQLKRYTTIAEQYNLEKELTWKINEIKWFIKYKETLISPIIEKITSFIQSEWWLKVYDNKYYKEEARLIIYGWIQLLLKDINTKLRSPNLLKIISPYEDNLHPDIFDWRPYSEVAPKFPTNYEEMKQALLVLKEEIGIILENGNLVTGDNHWSWFNLPFLAQTNYDVLWISHENQYIVAGFILLCAELWFYWPINSANILTTVPNTESTNGMVWVDNITKKIRLKFTRSFKNLSKGNWNVIHIVPSWTTDIRVDEYRFMEYPQNVTLKLLESFMNYNKNNRFLTIGLEDDRAMKTLWNFQPCRIPFGISSVLSLWDAYEGSFWEYVMQELAKVTPSFNGYVKFSRN